MNRLDIEQCSDISVLKKLAIEQYRQLFFISETLVDVSKTYITSEQGIEQIRNYLTKNQGKLEL